MASMSFPVYVLSSGLGGGDIVYATARSTAGGISTGWDVGQDKDIASTYHVYRTFFCFDTSMIPLGAVITRAYLSGSFSSISREDGDYDIQIIQQDWSGQNPLTYGNMETAWDDCLAGSVEAVWKHVDVSTLTTTLYNSPDLDITWINPLGYTYYSLRSSDDASANIPAGSNVVRVDSPFTLIVEYPDICPPPWIYYSPGAVSFS